MTTHPRPEHDTHPAKEAAGRESDGARQFAEVVELRSCTNGFLTREGEASLLEKGIRDYGLSLAEARGILHSVADEQGTPTEREVERTIAQWIKADAGRRRKLSRAQFRRAVEVYESQAHAMMSHGEVERRVKALMEEQHIEPRRAGLLRSRRWYYRI